jgi:hypothetical protein
MQATETNAVIVPANATPETIVATVKAKPAKRSRKPKAAKPAKPANAAERSNADRERCIANRAIVAVHYNGPSLTSHASRAPKLADALARIATPIQRAKSATTRDESALLLCLKHSDKAGTFCPVAATADLGALSRLASLGFLTVAGNRAKLTKAGAERARNVQRKQA